MSEPILDRTVWVACDRNSGVIHVALSRREAGDALRAYRNRARRDVALHRLSGQEAKMPHGGKVVRLTLPGAGYDALFPKEHR